LISTPSELEETFVIFTEFTNWKEESNQNRTTSAIADSRTTISSSVTEEAESTLVRAKKSVSAETGGMLIAPERLKIIDGSVRCVGETEGDADVGL
jgi:hypothetical protein